MLHEVILMHGRVDILVNNAGITIDRTVAKMASSYITGQIWAVNGGLDM